jgi:hypothetical protein
MNPKSRDLLSATLVGAVLTGVITAVLEAGGLTAPISDGVGAFVGGAAAAYFLYGKVSQAATVGALSGVIGTPFYLGMAETLFIAGLITNPPGPTPSLSELQAALAVITGLNLLLALFGAVIVGSARHPREEAMMPPQQQAIPATLGTIPSTTTPQTKYCVQCGAQLPWGALMCPHCNARQP